MRVVPSTRAVSVGMMISSSNRERTRQFFSERRDGRAAGGACCPDPVAFWSVAPMAARAAARPTLAAGATRTLLSRDGTIS